ncbi:nucleotide pyrophosphohydrolase [bacterium]|nr:nucleotide pyrophosphohydrolase [bacterium]
MSFEIMEDLENKVIDWGYDKGILHSGEATKERKLKQFSKTEEEVAELLDAILAEDKGEAVDAIGDILVTLIMQAKLWNTNLYECLDEAYEVISKRTGRMVDGIFVKDK